MSPALAGRFLTTVPPGKPPSLSFDTGSCVCMWGACGLPVSRSGLPTATWRCAGHCTPFQGPCGWWRCLLSLGGTLLLGWSSRYIWAWSCMGLSGADQAPGPVLKGPTAQLASTLDPPWHVCFLLGSLSVSCLCGSLKGRTNPALCRPWQVSPPPVNKCWLKIPLYLLALEEGTWPLGGSLCSPETEAHSARGPRGCPLLKSHHFRLQHSLFFSAHLLGHFCFSSGLLSCVGNSLQPN